ncbi:MULTISPECIES: serine aminopeptidase domain-containing protein [Shouchella]|uniref:Alpha/beta hydrolase n=1 Tax=Shouchella hunanensis TaxID=766894 RepID=A0ABY7W8A0_9BACI|nr:MULTISPECIES: alpha/beta hydrolase [Shouchella]WDF04062.1 alpha/beta hydrolase [Shouchella hunanensis]
MIIQEDMIHTVPMLVVEEEGSDEKPTLFFYHGVTSAKEHNLHIAYTIAKQGFRVILPDALYHGTRGEGTHDPYHHFWTVVQQSITEFPDLVEGVVERYAVQEDELYIGGTSMGAITSYGLLARYEWIKKACLFMGAPQYEEFSKLMFEVAAQRGTHLTEEQKKHVLDQVRIDDLSKDVSVLKGRQLYIWHGTEDETVPYSFAESFLKQLKDAPDVNNANITFFAEKGADHKITRKAILDASAWFEKQSTNQDKVTLSYES